MNELSLFILDLVQNSFKAHSKLVEIIVNENIIEDKFSIEISDDGIGMNEEILKKVTSPFYTTRTTRKVGLGIPLFKELCELCEGSFSLKSEEGYGTDLKGVLKYSSIDRPILGNIVQTLYTLVINDDGVDIKYKHIFNNKTFTFDTREIKKILDGVSLKEYDVYIWFNEFVSSSIESIKK